MPFHIVITFSGLLLLMTMLMPWGAQAVYDGQPQRFNAERRGMPMGAPNGERGEGRSTPAPLAPIAPILAAAQACLAIQPKTAAEIARALSRAEAEAAGRQPLQLKAMNTEKFALKPLRIDTQPLG